MALLEMWQIPGELTVTLEYNPANFRVTAVHFTNNTRRREAEIKIKVPPRAVVSAKTLATAEAESITVIGADGAGVIGPDPEGGDIGMVLNSEVEFQPGEPTI